MQQRNFASSLVIADYPLQVLPKLAKAIGLNQAIFVQQLHYWLNSSQYFYDESFWIYNTVEEWQEQFPFWSKKTVQRVINKTREIDLVITTKKYNTAQTDHKLWYTINYATLSQMENISVPSTLVVKSRNGQNDQIEIDNLSKIGTDCPFPRGQNDQIEMDNLTRSLYRTETNLTETTNRDYTETTTTTDPRDRARQPDPEEVVVVVPHPPEVLQLIEIGLPEAKAVEFFNARGPAYIQEKIEILHNQAEVRYPSRWLLAALEKDFQPESYVRPDPAEQQHQKLVQQMAAEQQAYEAKKAARLAKAQQAEAHHFQNLHTLHGLSQYHFDRWKEGIDYCKDFVLQGNSFFTEALEATVLLDFSENHARIGVLDEAMMFQLQKTGRQFLSEAIAYAMRDELQPAKITYDLEQL